MAAAKSNNLTPLESDEYLQQFSKWLRSKERRIASSSPQALLRRKTSQTWLAALSLSSVGLADPLLLKLSLHHLDVLLLKFEEHAMDKKSMGPFDVPLDFQPARPSSTVFLDGLDDAQSAAERKQGNKGFDTMSMFSWMSSASTSTAPTPASLSRDARYCFSAFTKIPSLQLSSTDTHFGLVKGFESLPDTSFVPLDLFKNLQLLRLVDIDARVLFGWDRLCQSLKVLEISGSDLDDLQSLLVDRVARDAAVRRREFSNEEEQDAEETPRQPEEAWLGLRRLALSSNALTFAPSEEFWHHFPNLVHLDLSNNLLLQVPDGLASLLSLRSLNLSNNMIESLSGISSKLGSVHSLDLSRNRIHSLAGIERLKGLQSIDISHNSLDEAAEVARLAPLPHLALLVTGEGNQLTNLHAKLPWRVELFVAFARENNDSILIDGTRPTWLESRTIAAELLKDPAVKKRQLTQTMEMPTSPPLVRPQEQSNTIAQAATEPPPTAGTSQQQSEPSQPAPSPPALSPIKTKQKRRRKPAGRIVDLDGNISNKAGDSQRAPHSRSTSASDGIASSPSRHQRYQSIDATIASPTSDEESAAGPSATVEGEAYRKHIEHLRSEVGEDWLRVLSQENRAK